MAKIMCDCVFCSTYSTLAAAVADSEKARARPATVRKCRSCKRAPWTCRSCGVKTCEHLCSGKKPDGTATCGACKRASNPFAARTK